MSNSFQKQHGKAAIFGLSATLCISACATAGESFSASPDADQRTALRQDFADFWLGNFGELSLKSFRKERDDHSWYLRVVISPSFAPPLLVAARKDHYGTEFSAAHIYAKTFGPVDAGPNVPEGLIGHGYWVPRDFGIVGWTKESRESYAAQLAPADFDLIEESFRASGAPDFSTVKLGSDLCTDGTTYYVDYSLDGTGRSFSRHSCDPSFSADFEAIETLMELAAQKLPALSKSITAYSAGISTDTIDH